MKNKLTKIIELGIERGYKLSFIPDWKNLQLIKLFDEWILDNDGIIRASLNGILLSKEFAKAYWGEEEMCVTCGEKFTSENEMGDWDMCDSCIKYASHDDNLGAATTSPAWKYHLQQAVIADDLIEYYWEHK